MSFSVAGNDPVLLSLPTWTPGAYEISDYMRKVSNLVITGDGELQEGSNWEAIMSAAHFGLDQLTLIIDRNRLQQGARTEATNGLDPRSARVVKDVLRDICDRGATVFITTHVLAVAEEMCDRVAILQDGQLVAIGTVAELRAQVAAPKASLEDIFLGLTGAVAYDDQDLSLYEEGAAPLAGEPSPAPA